MDRLFTEVAMHQALARVIDHLGMPRFWRNLILLLNDIMPFDNALALRVGLDGMPHVLEEFKAGGTDASSPVPIYLNGLYLLDPFLQVAHEGLNDGLFRLEEVAPDMFRQSEYFLNYFRDAVGEDELQLIVNVAPAGSVVSLSLGAKARFDVEALGRLMICTPWLIATIRQHWGRVAAEPGKSNNSSDLSGQVERALAGFGAELLSEREMAIVRLVLRGNSSKAIAERLTISPETVKVHRRNLYNKLGISTQPELFSLFIQALGHEER